MVYPKSVHQEEASQTLFRPGAWKWGQICNPRDSAPYYNYYYFSF